MKSTEAKHLDVSYNAAALVYELYELTEDEIRIVVGT